MTGTGERETIRRPFPMFCRNPQEFSRPIVHDRQRRTLTKRQYPLTFVNPSDPGLALETKCFFAFLFPFRRRSRPTRGIDREAPESRRAVEGSAHRRVRMFRGHLPPVGTPLVHSLPSGLTERWSGGIRAGDRRNPTRDPDPSRPPLCRAHDGLDGFHIKNNALAGGVCTGCSRFDRRISRPGVGQSRSFG